MQDNIFIDSNIFLYAFSSLDIRKQNIARDIVLSDATISHQVINEVSVNMLKKFKFKENDILDFITSCYSRYKVFDLNKDVFISASDIRLNYSTSYYDSIIISTAINASCDILYSEDMQINQIFNNMVKIVNPFV